MYFVAPTVSLHPLLSTLGLCHRCWQQQQLLLLLLWPSEAAAAAVIIAVGDQACDGS